MGSFIALFRAVLLLHEIDPPVTKPELLAAAVRHLGLDAAVFERVAALRERDAKRLDDVAANKLFTEYMEQIERVIEAVDKLNKT